ncbi:unnamed protein product [marine sediment metagenome]|uniref:Uncharacterized protein n=1 Tax=marine sediment metagenome TaxID=412755 RepID=X1R657_9ZZZZ
MRLEQQVERWKRRKELPKIKVVEEIQGIYLYLLNAEGSYFDPFCERVQSDEFQALGKVLTWATENKWERIERSAKKAHAKIEAIAKGEIPTRLEIRKGKEMLSLWE